MSRVVTTIWDGSRLCSTIQYTVPAVSVKMHSHRTPSEIVAWSEATSHFPWTLSWDVSLRAIRSGFCIPVWWCRLAFGACRFLFTYSTRNTLAFSGIVGAGNG